MSLKTEVLTLIRSFRNGVTVGYYDKDKKEVSSREYNSNRVERLLKLLENMYDENLNNKVNKSISIFKIKEADGKPYTKEDYVDAKPEKKPVEEKLDEEEKVEPSDKKKAGESKEESKKGDKDEK